MTRQDILFSSNGIFLLSYDVSVVLYLTLEGELLDLEPECNLHLVS